MFKGLTERAQRVINVLAQEEAKKLNHDKLLPEHILLGFIREGEGVAIKALINLGIDLNMLRENIVANTKKSGEFSSSVMYRLLRGRRGSSN